MKASKHTVKGQSWTVSLQPSVRLTLLALCFSLMCMEESFEVAVMDYRHRSQTSSRPWQQPAASMRGGGGVREVVLRLRGGGVDNRRYYDILGLEQGENDENVMRLFPSS